MLFKKDTNIFLKFINHIYPQNLFTSNIPLKKTK